MKKIIVILIIFITIFLLCISVVSSNVYATNTVDTNENSRIVELKEQQAKTLKEYQAKYNSESYGLTAYILHIVQVYSIPFCFLGIVISLIYKVVIGARHLENAEKGLGMIVAIVTITIICQVLPLVFAIVVKMGKE